MGDKHVLCGLAQQFVSTGLVFSIKSLFSVFDWMLLLRVHETLAALIWKAALKLSLCMCTRMPGDNPSMMKIQAKDSTSNTSTPVKEQKLETDKTEILISL